MAIVKSVNNTPQQSMESGLPESPLQNLQLTLQNLNQAGEVDLAALVNLHRETIRLQPNTVEVYQAIADGFLRFGEPLIAYDVLSEGIKKWPQDLKLQQSMALALARSGATISANTLLQSLVDGGQQDETTLGLLARTHKDLWSQASSESLQQQHLSLAAQYYEHAYRLSQNPWTGINAATMALLQGHPDRAAAVARQIQQQCLATLAATKAGDDTYWTLATLGEAALLLDDLAQAEDFYGQAIAVGEGRFGDLSSSCRNATLLLQHQGRDTSLIRQWFQIPKVAVFCGHMVDTPGRPTPRFPPYLETAVYEAIRDRLERNNIRFGYASAACGADILFLEAVLALKGEIHVVLPYDQQQFLQDSIAIVPNGNWRQRFDAVIEQATELIIASQHKVASENEVFYEYSYRMLHGLAKVRSTQLNTELMPLTVWNGKPGDGFGGTSSAVHYWQQWSEAVEIIDLEALLASTPPVEVNVTSLRSHSQTASLADAQPAPSETGPIPEISLPLDFNPELRAMLFADVVNFSQMREEQFPAFVRHFLGTVAQFSQDSNNGPLFQNTWGDALYFVFASVQDAGIFALELCNLIHTIDWQAKGLPEDLNLRIALHAGPVARYRDPVTSHENYIGSHVNHTARIEPITPPGKVYASQAFAALSSSEGVVDFTCDYVGKTPYAKQYGTFPTYHVCRCRN
ncbi:MAG: TRAFs-binding domain-containing protein [Cyanobacteria bacterium P01_H01_bin.58]